MYDIYMGNNGVNVERYQEVQWYINADRYVIPIMIKETTMKVAVRNTTEKR